MVVHYLTVNPEVKEGVTVMKLYLNTCSSIYITSLLCYIIYSTTMPTSIVVKTLFVH